ncbi:SDR family NAD(P)-dependent oxidoreductase [Streptomyces cyanogenus]|uniref:Sulfoacetaldehyde reductase n=1 Tax=Streptomyces cyanogenus TaxID=80860 RepID=A0ABX7U179_STRCY|nr:SDR family NAD(P)-dependent oxidoreductase [Streptomyces cyanogenus]QTE02783.1 Sulfoacetaldehyde reductase [Streptomyces cyanogenus]
MRALADAGHTVYAGIRQPATRNAPAVAGLDRYAVETGVPLHAVELDVQSQDCADAAVARVPAAEGRLDVVVLNAGHMVTGPAEAFASEQLAELYDVNVLGAQRVSRAALPRLRERGEGLLVWIGSSGTRGGCLRRALRCPARGARTAAGGADAAGGGRGRGRRGRRTPGRPARRCPARCSRRAVGCEPGPVTASTVLT